MQSFIKPGLKMTEICQRLERKTHELVVVRARVLASSLHICICKDVKNMLCCSYLQSRTVFRLTQNKVEPGTQKQTTKFIKVPVIFCCHMVHCENAQFSSMHCPLSQPPPARAADIALIPDLALRCCPFCSHAPSLPRCLPAFLFRRSGDSLTQFTTLVRFLRKVVL